MSALGYIKTEWEAAALTTFVTILFMLCGIAGAMLYGIIGFLVGLFFGPVGVLISAMLRKMQQQEARIGLAQSSASSTYRAEKTNSTSIESRWELLKQADAEIALAASEVRQISPGLENILRDKYLTLNEKRLLRPIFDLVIKDWNDRVLSSSEAIDAAGDRDFQEYLEFIGPEKFDKWRDARVVSVNKYHGSWRAFNNGLVIKFEDGRVMITRKSLSRVFANGDDSWV